MKIAKVRNVKTPSRANSNDAGIDFYIPEFDSKFIEDLRAKNPGIKIISDENGKAKTIYLKPQERILIPSGIHVNFTKEAKEFNYLIAERNLYGNSVGLALIAHNKSGVASKKGLDRLAEVVDESYQGEVHINVVNTGYDTIKLEAGEKLIQFVLIPVIYSTIEETELKDLYTEISNRGANGFGSTDKK